MPELLESAWIVFWRAGLPYVFLAGLLLGALLWVLRPKDRRKVASTLGFLLLCIIGQYLSGLITAPAMRTGALILNWVFVFGTVAALIRLAGLCLFHALLPAIGLILPRIVEDLIIILAYIGFALVVMRLAGVDLSGIVATSAVITAVLAFAMQDTLGNILGGLALQLDSSIDLGDWIKVDDITGRVENIRWRFTAIRTRNGEILIVPNSQLMKSKFMVIRRISQKDQSWRRWIWFNVDYRVPPAQVIATVEQAVGNAEIPHVARLPAPNCVMMEFGPTWARYALRYWLTDPQPDDPTDSAVRINILAALQRAGLRVAEPEYSVHMTRDNEDHRLAVEAREMARRLKALSGVEIFAAFTAEELEALARRLVYAPFANGDTITRQGMVGHWLYILVTGEVDIWFEQGNVRRRLTTLAAGKVFGEMSMLTGELRQATVTAKGYVECYRLDKSGFEDILRSRPEIADALAEILSERNDQLSRARQSLDREPAASDRQTRQASLLGSIRDFFKLG